VNAAVEARDLFRVHASPEGNAAALQGLSLTVCEREVVVVFGPSGSGKTTLLRIVAGLDRPSAGTIRALGADVGRLRGRGLGEYRGRLIGYADQHYTRALASELTARELVALQLALLGEPRAMRLRRADELLERVRLADRADARPRELSGGEQQRVALCAALAHGPRLLLADEPTGELDAATGALVYDLLGELAREQGCTTVIVTHDQQSAAIADRVVQIRDGRVSAESAVDGAGRDRIVVGRGGWLQLPEEMLRRTGIQDRAEARLADTGIVVTAAGGDGARPQAEAPRPLARAGAGETAVELRDLRKRFGRGAAATDVFDGLTVTFATGRLAGVTGPSGSGKTTLLHLIAGLELPDAGTVSVLGRDVGALDRPERADLRRTEIALVEQATDLVPFLSAQENVELALGLRGVEPEAAATRARDALERVGLGELRLHRVTALSTGERQRVAIARALAAKPAVLLADEPTAHLDQASALGAGRLLAALAREGTAVVCATHDPALIEQADDELKLG
jgi:ABC-type lipoprotein export system ATPase subunit